MGGRLVVVVVGRGDVVLVGREEVVLAGRGEVYLHRGWGGLSGLFTWEVFTTIELFTGRAGVLRLSSVSGSSVGATGQLGSIGCSNIDASGLWTGGMIGRIGACCWFAGVLHKLYALGFAWPRRLMHPFGREGWFVCSQHSS